MDLTKAVVSGDLLSNKKNEIAIELIKFFEVVTHVILYQRNVYPSQLFKPTKKYGICINQSRHPQLNDYIAKVLMDGVYDFLEQGILNKFVIVIKERRYHKILEKFVFNVELNGIKDANDIVLLYGKFRDILVKLNVINSYFTEQHNSKKIIFTIQSHIKKFDRVKYRKWIEMDDNDYSEDDDEQQSRENNDNHNLEIIPVKSIKTEQFKMNVMAISTEKQREASIDPNEILTQFHFQ